MIVAAGERYRPLLARGLERCGLEALWMPDNPLIDPRLSGHADLSMARCGKNIVVSKGQDGSFVNLLTNRGYSVVRAEGCEGSRYPQDAGLCVLDTGAFLICNPVTADPAALRLLSARPLVAVAQGYTRCAAVPVNDDSIITADAGVSRAAKRAGLTVLDITPGAVRLEGFNEGFIGGASFRIGADTLAFTGSLDGHPDRARILDFLRSRQVRPLFLTDGPLIDIGGAFALP